MIYLSSGRTLLFFLQAQNLLRISIYLKTCSIPGKSLKNTIKHFGNANPASTLTNSNFNFKVEILLILLAQVTKKSLWISASINSESLSKMS